MNNAFTTLSKEEIEKAKERASILTSEPSLTAIEGLIRASLIIGATLGAFIGLAGLNSDEFGFPLLIVLIVGAGGTYFHYINLENKHLDACLKQEKHIVAMKKKMEKTH